MAQPLKGPAGIGRLWKALVNSLAGCSAAFQFEKSFRQEILLSIILIPAAMLLRVQYLAKVLMVASIFLVLITELINSAIEATVDRISMESHYLAKRAKDMASAAVFISLINVLCTWGIVLFYAYGD